MGGLQDVRDFNAVTNTSKLLELTAVLYIYCAYNLTSNDLKWLTDG